MLVQRISAVIPLVLKVQIHENISDFQILYLRTKRSSLHFFKAQCQNAVSDATCNQLIAHKKRATACSTIVVHIENRDACKPHLVQGSLTASRVT